MQATAEEVDAAAQAAAFAYPTFRNLPAARRADFLDAIAANWTLWMTVRRPGHRETALPSARIQGERAAPAARCACSPRSCVAAISTARIDRALPDRQPLPRVDLRQYRIGVGPVAVFGASNFPLAFSTAGGDTAAALAAGCPVVFKAHSGHMATADMVADAIIRAAEQTGMPRACST
jgi:NADP-dependent aldehyde dehydrogenase